jgi:hypothetical protein
MDVLSIEPTDNSPMILLDPHTLKFEISGESRPENAGKFYSNILSWLENFNKSAIWKTSTGEKISALSFDFKLEYFNSTSSKYLLDILKVICLIKESGCNVNINWYYDAMDEDMKESGEEFSQLIEVPFQYISR